MKPWTRRVLGGLAGLVLAAAALLALAIDRKPAVAERNDFSLDDVAHALAVARRHDPRYSVPGRPTQVTLTERDIELLLNHAAHRLLGVRVALQLQAGQARISASLPWQGAGLKGWLNLQADLSEGAGLPTLARWRLGNLPLPTGMAPPLLRAAAARLGGVPDLALVDEVVQQVRFAEREMAVDYTWQADTSQRLLAGLTPPAEQARLKAYNALLVELAARGPGWTMPLPALLGPMFELARQRSLTNDAVLENRAAVLTLALYVNGRRLGSVVPAARAWPQPRRLQVLLAGRTDFPQHFLVSAFLAMEGTDPLTHAIGLVKEVADAQGGSGFSFTDLAANRAGLRFGQLATDQPTQLQDRLARGVDEATLLPPVADLPEFLKQAEFEAAFGRVGSPRYQGVLADIEARLDTLPLYR
jgi:hypothetical protein